MFWWVWRLFRGYHDGGDAKDVCPSPNQSCLDGLELVDRVGFNPQGRDFTVLASQNGEAWCSRMSTKVALEEIRTPDPQIRCLVPFSRANQQALTNTPRLPQHIRWPSPQIAPFDWLTKWHFVISPGRPSLVVTFRCPLAPRPAHQDINKQVAA
jgi:hypothetical protein